MGPSMINELGKVNKAQRRERREGAVIISA